MFYREKKVDCSDYREVDIIPRTDDAERATKGKRGKRKKVTEPKQRNLNDKNSRRYLVQLGNGNFGIGDLHVTCTYSNEYLPESEEEAEQQVRNFLRRIKGRRERLGLEQLKYILVTEYGHKKGEEERITRIHHHIIMNGGMDRDEVEMMWSARRINWRQYEKNPEEYQKTVEKMGYVNADRLQLNENGIEALCKYVTKNPNGKKRWSSSRNLVRPEQQPNADHKYTRSKVERLAKSEDAGKEYFEKQFPDYTIVEIEPVYYEETGWHVYMKMWKKRQKKKKDGG